MTPDPAYRLLSSLSNKLILFGSHYGSPCTKLCYRFAVKNLKSDHSFFTKIVANAKTRHAGNKVYEYKCNFGRFRKSSIPYLARLLNSYNQ